MSKEDRIRTILQFLHDRNAAFPPKPLYDNLDIYENIDFSYSTVRRLLDELRENRLVEHLEVGKGYYRITDRGREFLDNSDSSGPFSVSIELREELEKKRDDIDEKFPNARPKLAKVASGKLGLWIRFNPGDDHQALFDGVADVGDYLGDRGYAYRWAYDSPYDPDLGDPHYEGHIYALPVEVGVPDDPVERMPSMADNRFETGKYVPDFA